MTSASGDSTRKLLSFFHPVFIVLSHTVDTLRGRGVVPGKALLASPIRVVEAETKDLDGQPLTTWMQKWSYVRFVSAVERAMHEIGRITPAFVTGKCLDSAPV